MFDKQGFMDYVGEASGASYAAGLSYIEKVSQVDIDAEFERDQCVSLLSSLEQSKTDKQLSNADLGSIQNRCSNLRKYIEFRKGVQNKSTPVVEQLRRCLAGLEIGTKLKRQEIIELVQMRYNTKASSIIPSDYCHNMTNKGIPADHVSFFLNVGTGEYIYVGEDYCMPTIENIIAAYKADFPNRDDQERYKWEALAHFQKHWDIDASNFAEMFLEAFRFAGEGYKRPRDGKLDGGNLLTSSMYYPYKMFATLAEFEPDTMRGYFRHLIDESEPLSVRYSQFREGCDRCLERLRATQPGYEKANNHYQDLRAISVYLTFVYPEKYFLYKYRMYKSFADLIGVRAKLETAKGNKMLSLTSYMKLCEQVLKVIEEDKELQELSISRLDDNSYKDPAFHLLTMDVIYFGSQLAREEAYKVKGIVESKSVTNTDIGLNTILYGPPGTGKTYTTAIYAVAIIENRLLADVQSESYDEVMARYNQYKADKRIEFTTFHQSYGYEEFIEGIKPNMEAGNDEEATVEYSIETGLFKDFCERASQPVTKKTFHEAGLNDFPNVWKVSLDGTGNNPVRSECLQNGHIRIGWDEYGEVITDETEYTIGGKKVLNAFINKMKVGDLICSCFSASTVDAIGVVTGDYEWHDEYDRMKRLRKVNWLVKGIGEDITELNGATMTLSSVYRLNISAADVMSIVLKNSNQVDETEPNDKNYVFIIDEINRGNISKIFGELITLIEPSKRLGQLEGTIVKLPYSKKPFGVPDNVYLLGTMNTADRSIATIDTALRRRFQFKEMQPDPEVLDGISVEDLSIKDLLIRMNQKISVLYDREHTIGHSYFIPLRVNPTIETLAAIFEDKIIPLLQEYFFDDYEKIRLVLGDNNKDSVDTQFIVAKNVDFEELFGSLDISIDDSIAYEINRTAFDDIDAYRSI